MAGRVVPVPDSEGPWAKAFATLSREEQDQFEQPELRSVDILKEASVQNICFFRIRGASAANRPFLLDFEHDGDDAKRMREKRLDCL